MKTDKDGYPTTCHHCHKPIIKRKHDSQHHHDHTTNTAYSWHVECSPATRLRENRDR